VSLPGIDMPVPARPPEEGHRLRSPQGDISVKEVMTPNPGSDEALDLGCLCAILDNNHGKYPPWPPDGWWITASCPVHAKENNA
jgi:hypothetical protein